MKKIIIPITAFAAVIYSVVSCNTTTYDEISDSANTTVTYNKDIQPIMSANCTSCHSQAGGQEPYLENYQQVKTNIDDILSEIKDGSMPPDGPLPVSTINKIQSWKDANTPE